MEQTGRHGLNLWCKRMISQDTAVARGNLQGPDSVAMEIGAGGFEPMNLPLEKYTIKRW